MAVFENEFTYRKFLDSGREEEFDRLFDSAVEEAKQNIIGKRFPMYIGGREVYSGEQIIECSPIDSKLVLGTFQKGTKEHARQAIEEALNAFGSWSNTDYRERVEIMRRSAKMISENKFIISAILSMENGKTRYESVGEVDEAIDFLNYYSFDMEKNKGYIRKNTLAATMNKVKAGFQGAPGSGEKVTIMMKPYGVFGVIAPFNFPVSISVGMSSGALITGNTVVFKPSSSESKSMLTGLKIYEAYKGAGMPDGVFNYITGSGAEIGNEISGSDKVSGVVFTGSRAVGMDMIARTYNERKQKIFVVEMGGKNPAIVSKYADIGKAVTGIAGAAYGFAGQKCSACSRVYVHESVRDEFVKRLIEKIKEFKIGDPLKKDVYVGPLINQRALEDYKKHTDYARQRGKILYGGNLVSTGLDGAYVEPELVEIDHSDKLFHQELFLPFLVLTSYKDFDDVMRKANDVDYGLTAGLYSEKVSEIKKFLDTIDAGTVYVNREVSATTGAIVGLHTFVGWKGSGLTGKGTGSRMYLQQFMREQSQAVVK